MELLIEPSGDCRCVYSEEIELTQLGAIEIRRASHVEPGCDNSWRADLSPIGGPTLGPFKRRSDAIEAERLWLQNWLTDQKNHSRKFREKFRLSVTAACHTYGVSFPLEGDLHGRHGIRLRQRVAPAPLLWPTSRTSR